MAEESDDRALLDALKPYLALASGLMEVSAGKAAEFAQSIVTQGAATGATAVDRVQEVAGLGIDPDQFAALVRDEVDRVARRVGFVRADEIASLRRQVERLEVEVAGLRADAETKGRKAPKGDGKGDGHKGKSKAKH